LLLSCCAPPFRLQPAPPRSREWSSSSFADALWGVVLTPDGRLLISVSGDAVIRFWDVESGVLLRAIECYEHCNPALSRDGRWLAFADGAAVAIYDLTTGEESKRWTAPERLHFDPVFSPDGHAVIFAGERSLLRFDTESGQVLNTISFPDKVEVRAISATPDRETFVTAATQSGSTEISVWTTATMTQRHTLTSPERYFGGTFVVRPDGRELMMQTGADRLDFFPLPALAAPPAASKGKGKAKNVAPEPAHDGPTGVARISAEGSVSGAAYSPDMAEIAIAHSDTVVGTTIAPLKVYSRVTGKPVRTLAQLRSSSTVAYSLDGRAVVANGSRGSVDF
jgi:hypothetical protein